MSLPKPIEATWKPPAPKPLAQVQPVKRKFPSSHLDPLSYSQGRGSCKRRLQSPETPERVEPALSRAIRPLDVMFAQIDAWRKREVESPMSNNKSDLRIDLGEAYILPCEATSGSWASWRRHNERIEANIEKTREFCGVLTRRISTMRSKGLSRHFESG